MNKKFAAVLAATCVLGATTAFAANPFSDVTPSDWAYQAVAQLAAEGVIDGYPDGTFKGERNITRYEMAQMVARAMARQDQVDAEQQAQIDRLANEFANELNSLGVRVSNLENRVGNVKVTGDARVRWQDQKDDSFDMRARLQFNANVSDKTEAVARVTTDNFRIDGESKDAVIRLDRLYVAHKFDGFKLTGGRYGETLGETGYWYDDNVDGVKADFGYNDFKATVGYGTLKGIQLGSYEYMETVAKLKESADKAQKDLADLKKGLEENPKIIADAEKKFNDATAAVEKANADIPKLEAQVSDAESNYQDAVDQFGENSYQALKAMENLHKVQTAVIDAIAAKNKGLKDMVEATKEKTHAVLTLEELNKNKEGVEKAEKEATAAYDKFVAEKKNFLKEHLGMESTYAQLKYQGKNFHLTGVYIAPNGEKVKADKLDSVWGAGAAVIINDQFKLSGDYFSVQGEGSRKDADFWVARVDFGKADLKKPGSFNIFVDYVNAEPFSYMGGSGALRNESLLNDTKSWGVGAGFVVAENVLLEAFRSFNAETHSGADLDDFTKVQLVYKF